jgi:hypothetical protein
LPYFRYLFIFIGGSSCNDTEIWCMFLSKYECEHDDSKGKCPKTCGICKGGETHALFDGNVLIS